jgi:hypothetical protein
MPNQLKEKATKETPPMDIWVLTEPAPAGIQKFGALEKIPVDKLREHLQNFTAAVSSALSGVQAIAGKFQLKEVGVEATFSAEAGFALVTKVGVQGAVTLKFVRE